MDPLLCLLCLLVSCTFLVGVRGEGGGVSLESPSGVVFLRRQSSVVVPCKPSLPSEYECQWLRNGRPVIVGKGVWKSKYDWPGKVQDASDCSVTFVNVSVADHEGTWQCVATDHHSESTVLTSAKTKFLVTEMPANLSVSFSEGVVATEILDSTVMVTVREGFAFRAICASCCSRPRAMLQWRPGPQLRQATATKPNVTIERNDTERDDGTWLLHSTLEMEKVKRHHHRTQYSCWHAMKGAPPVLHKPINVLLNVLYHPEAPAEVVNVSYPKYALAFLPCPLDGNPVPTYAWFREQKGGGGDGWTLLSDDDKMLARYFIRDDDLGVYKCSATNTVEEETKTAEAMIRLSFGERARPPKRAQKQTKTAGDAKKKADQRKSAAA